MTSIWDAPSDRDVLQFPYPPELDDEGLGDICGAVEPPLSVIYGSNVFEKTITPEVCGLDPDHAGPHLSKTRAWARSGKYSIPKDEEQLAIDQPAAESFTDEECEF